MLTGGEPTLHPQFYEVVQAAKEFGFIIILSTNGSTLNKIFSKVCDYIDSYCISFDGCNKKQYYDIRGIDNYDNIVKSIGKIKNYNENIQVWLGCLIQKKNFTDIVKIYEAANKTSADGIFFNVPELKGGCFGRKEDGFADKKLIIDKRDIYKLEKEFEIMIKRDSGRELV